MLLTHYTELSPPKQELREWCSNNHALLQRNYEELSWQEMMVAYRREIVGDLTGREGNKPRAKFIYDLYDVVSPGPSRCLCQCLITILPSLKAASQKHIVTLSLRTSSRRRFSSAMVADLEDWLRHVHRCLKIMIPSIQFRMRHWHWRRLR